MKIEIRESILGKVARCAECGQTVGLFKEATEMRTAIQHHACVPVTVTNEIEGWITISLAQRGYLAVTEIQARAVLVKLATALNDLAFAREQQEMKATLDQPLDADEQAEADAQPNHAVEGRR